jgi:hypothetical protein
MEGEEKEEDVNMLLRRKHIAHLPNDPISGDFLVRFFSFQNFHKRENDGGGDKGRQQSVCDI